MRDICRQDCDSEAVGGRSRGFSAQFRTLITQALIHTSSHWTELQKSHFCTGISAFLPKMAPWVPERKSWDQFPTSSKNDGIAFGFMHVLLLNGLLNPFEKVHIVAPSGAAFSIAWTSQQKLFVYCRLCVYNAVASPYPYTPVAIVGKTK